MDESFLISTTSLPIMGYLHQKNQKIKKKRPLETYLGRDGKKR